MPVTTFDGLLEAWAEQTETMEQNFEALYGAPTITPSLPSVTNRDGLLEEITNHTERMLFNLITKKCNLVKISSTDVSKTEQGVTYTDNRDGTFTVSTSGTSTASTEVTLGPAVTFKKQHVYYIGGAPESASYTTYFLYFHTNSGLQDTGGGTVNDRGNYANYSYVPKIKVAYGINIPTPVVFVPAVYDLTEIFGSGHEPKTVEEFEAYAHRE